MGISTGSTKFSINKEGRLDVVQHAHPDNGWLHWESPSLGIGTHYAILVDISDAANYPHVKEDWPHIEFMRIHVDSDNNGAYTLDIGFIEDIDGTDAEFYSIININGSKQLGNQKDINIPFYPNGVKCSSEHVATQASTDPNINTGTPLPSTLNPGTANVIPGNRDLIVKIVVVSGNIIAGIDAAYHSH